MYNKLEFEKWVAGTGLKKKKIAENLGLDPAYLSTKISGRVKFSAVEGAALMLMGMTQEEYMHIFGG